MVQLLDKKFENIVQERHKIEQAIDEEISSEMTLKHGTEFQDKELQKTRGKIHEKEITQAKVNNQIARLRVTLKLFKKFSIAARSKGELHRDEGLEASYPSSAVYLEDKSDR